jgi:molecular chaperone GrpE
MNPTDQPSSAPETKPAEAPQGLPAPEVSAIEKELEEVRAQAAANLDKFVRAKAETDNIRRRAEQDVANAHKYGVERFAGEVVAVRDSLDLAQAVDLSQGGAEAVQKMHEGLALTLKLMDDTLRKFGVVLLDPKGEKFDPNRHQAISMVESGEVPANHVLTVVQKGYLLHDRVLRPAMVVVAKSPATT